MSGNSDSDSGSRQQRHAIPSDGPTPTYPTSIGGSLERAVRYSAHAALDLGLPRRRLRQVLATIAEVVTLRDVRDAVAALRTSRIRPQQKSKKALQATA